MKNLLTHFSKIRGYFSASQSNDVGYDCRLTVVRQSFDCRSTMLKLVSVLVILLTLGVGNAWGQTQFATTSVTTTSSPYTVACAKSTGSTAPNATYGDFVRCYANNKITISTASGNPNIREIHIVWSKNSGKTFASVSAGAGSYSHPSGAGTGIWTGNASSVEFTVGSSGQIQIVSVTIYTCVKPSAIVKGTVTSSSFGLTITDAANTNNYEVYFNTSSTAPTISTTASTTVTSKTPTISSGVSAGTTYYVWVRSKCSNTSKSAWVALTGNTLTTSAASCSVNPTAPTGAKGASLNGPFKLTSTTGSIGVTTSGWTVGANCAWDDYGYVWSLKSNNSSPTVGGTKSNKVQKGTSGTATSWTDNLTPSGSTDPTSWTTGSTYCVRAYGKNKYASGSTQYTSVYEFTPQSITYKDGSSTLATHYVPKDSIVPSGNRLADPTKTGYDFSKWCAKSDLSVDFSWSNAITKDTIIYAKWTAKSYGITSTLTNCSSSPSIPSSYSYTGEAAGLTYTITPTSGYGLPSSISVSGTTYTWDPSNGTLVLTGVISSAVSISITANTLYTVTFNKGTGTCATTSLQGTSVDGVTLPTPTHACDGWSFAGWTTGSLVTTETSNAPATLYSGGSNYKPSNNITLYAVYQKGDGKYHKITSTPASIPGKYVIANVEAGQSLKDQVLSTYYMAAEAVTITDGTTINSPSATSVWDVSYSSSKWYFKHGSNYLYNWHNVSYYELGHTTTASGYSVSFDGSGYAVFSYAETGDDNGAHFIYYYYSGTSTHEFKAVQPSDETHNLTLFKLDKTYYSNPECCAKSVTFSASATNGTVAFTVSTSPVSSITTCGEDKEVTMTITPAAGYKLTAYSSNTGTVEPSDTDPAVATSGADSKSAQEITLTFDEDANGTCTIATTFTAMKDTYKDQLHGDVNTDFDEDGKEYSATYTVPNLTNPSAGSGDCESEHYKFVGWVEESYVKSDGTLKSGFTIYTAGSSGTASEKTYIAIWAKEL